ncbi:hypothetical protein [Burkholderia ambifaria]|uniref:hypothetical protein n=1 Tax=Burkholderia ambifaria TaxID=152480 RepID=UPI00158A222B|nr:hypothetical protein [Burkholderia ambifaria]
MRKYDTASSPARRAAARGGTCLRQRNTRTASTGGHRVSDLCAAARCASHGVLRQFASTGASFYDNFTSVPGTLCSDERKHCFHPKKHDRAKGRAATPNGARRDTAPTLKIRDERCDTFPANTLIATLPRAFYRWYADGARVPVRLPAIPKQPRSGRAMIEGR